MARISKNITGAHILEGIDAKIVKSLSRKCVFHDYGPGDIIVRKGDTNTDVYFVVSGQVAVFNYVDNSAQVFLAEFYNSDVFGELAAIDGGVRSAWVVAVKDCTIAVMPGAMFMDAVTNHADITRNFMKHLSNVIRGTGTRIRNLNLLSPRQRIAIELMRLAGVGERVSGEASISEMPSHSAMASYVTTTREVIAETMGELLREKALTRIGRTLRINDISFLRRLADEGEYKKLDSEKGVHSLFKEIYA